MSAAVDIYGDIRDLLQVKNGSLAWVGDTFHASFGRCSTCAIYLLLSGPSDPRGVTVYIEAGAATCANTMAYRVIFANRWCASTRGDQSPPPRADCIPSRRRSDVPPPPTAPHVHASSSNPTYCLYHYDKAVMVVANSSPRSDAHTPAGSDSPSESTPLASDTMTVQPSDNTAPTSAPMARNVASAASWSEPSLASDTPVSTPSKATPATVGVTTRSAHPTQLGGGRAEPCRRVVLSGNTRPGRKARRAHTHGVDRWKAPQATNTSCVTGSLLARVEDLEATLTTRPLIPSVPLGPSENPPQTPSKDPRKTLLRHPRGTLGSPSSDTLKGPSENPPLRAHGASLSGGRPELRIPP